MDNNIEEKTTFEHKHRLEPINTKNEPLFKLRNILNLVFMILAIVGAIVYWFSHQNQNIAICIFIVAVVFKFAEVSLRLFHK